MTAVGSQRPSRKASGARQGFAPFHPWDRNFFLAYVGLIWFVILMGFVPDVIHHVEEHRPPYPLIVHLHAVVMVGWLILLTVQVLAVRIRRIDIHRWLGFAGAGLAAAVVVLGLATAWIVDRQDLNTPDFDAAFLSVQVLDMAAFGGAAAAAVAMRADPSAHKRLILLATLSLVDAGYVRWLGKPMTAWLGDGFWPFMAEVYLANGVLILGIGAYDLITRRRLHPAYIAGSAGVWGALMLAGLRM